MKLAQKLAINYLRAKLNIIAVISRRRAAKKALDIFSTPFRKAVKKPSPVFSRGEKLVFESDGCKISGHRWNVGGSKKILIVHGFESSSANFGAYVNVLTRKGMNVLAFDAPAHGKSSGKKITLPKYIKTLQDIDKRYGPFDGYLAHSFGGLALTHFLETSAHKASDRVVLIAPATETTTAIDTFFKFLDLNAQIRKEFDELVIEKTGIHPDHFSIRRAVHQIKAAILWIHDQDDKTTPLSDAQKVFDDGHPNIRFVITQGLGHRKIYKDEQVMKQVVDFLSET
jgi:pimeloyl-ACP methyl ester carboxylesterase